MTYWHELITTALVGTERQRPGLPSGGTTLGDSLAGLEGQSPERLLLAAAGTTALYQRVGSLPARDERSLPSPAEPDAQPVCTIRAAQQLELMLAGTHAGALPEWLRAAAARGVRVPEHLLPELLQAGRQDRSLRAPILEVAGKRGRWLAAQNRDWSYLAIEDEEDSSWETGSRAARQLILSRIRAADPERARKMVEETWSQEAADDRTAFLATFRQGLSLEDEPFLEAALDDRSKGVRQTAADLLARLPGSALQKRMWERVRPLVTVDSTGGILGLGRTVKIQVTLPAECDKAMQRDGVEAKLPAHERRFGEKAWWLMQMLASVPPSTWSESAQAGADEVVAAALKTEWKDSLLWAWATAAERARDADWAEALLALGDSRLQALEGLVELLPPPRREALAIKLLTAGPKALDTEHPAMQVVLRCRHDWSDELSRAVLEQARKRVANQKRYDWSLHQALPGFGLYIRPELADEAATGWPEFDTNSSYWSEQIERLTSMLQFRREMLEEIQR